MANLRIVTDQMGYELKLSPEPLRIVSLVPSITELLYTLGLDREIVGQTLFCIHPAAAHQIKPRVGGTKTLNYDKIRLLKPNLIIGNKEENTKEDIEALQAEFPVWMSDIQTPEDALQMIEMLGNITGKTLEATALVLQIRKKLEGLVRTERKRTCIYFIWQKPYMAAGNDTFIGSMLALTGFYNLMQDNRYPECSPEEIKRLNPEFILLSSEPFPFAEKHREAIAANFPEARVVLVDGEMFSWYGSRMLLAVDYLAGLQKMLF